MSLRFLLILSGGLEALVGVLVIFVPATVVTSLLGSPLDLVSIALARLFGVGIFSLGLACLKARDDLGTPAGVAVSLGITSYNVLAAIVLVWMAMSLNLGGPLLWAAGLSHAVLGVLFVHSLIVEKNGCARQA